MAPQYIQQMGFPTSEYDDNGWKLYITSLVMITSAGIFVMLRCGTRLWLSKLGWDDVAVIASLCFSIVTSVSMQLAISHGYGMHKEDLSEDELSLALEFFYIAQAPYKVTVCLNKVATILLYLRIFSSPKFRVAAFVVMAITVAGSSGAICATIFQCVPVSGAWDLLIKAKCINSDRFWPADAVLNIVTDVAVLILPIPMVVKLNLGRRDKTMLYGLFLLGGFVTITSILRTTSVENSPKNKMDITYNFITRGIWTLIEANLGIIVPCLVVLRQPLGIFFPRIFGPEEARPAFNGPGGRGDEKGYHASDLSTARQDGGLWQGSNLATQSVFISGPGEQASRHIDDRHIVGDMSKDGAGELDGKKSTAMGGISKTVEVVRTSVHHDQDYYSTGGCSGPGEDFLALMSNKQ